MFMKYGLGNRSQNKYFSDLLVNYHNANNTLTVGYVGRKGKPRQKRGKKGIGEWKVENSAVFALSPCKRNQHPVTILSPLGLI